MTHKIGTRGSFLLLAALPVIATGCGGDGSTGNGVFGGTSQPLVATPSTTSPITSGTDSGNLTPNAAPSGVSPGTASGGAVAGTAPGQSASPEAVVTNGSLAPLSGTYTGTWTSIPPVKVKTDPQAAAPAQAAPATGGAVTLKLAYPKHPSKTVLGDVSGTWVEPALGGVGRLSGTVDRIGLPREPNAVHVVGKVTFPGGKTRPLVVELAEETVGHLGGSDASAAIFLKKTR